MLQDSTIPVWSSDGPPVISAPAEIDIANSEQLHAALLLASHQARTVVVDMSQTVFCDSSAINILVRAARRASAEGGELRLAACTAPVLRTMSIVGADQLLLLCATLADALARPAGQALSGT